MLFRSALIRGLESAGIAIDSDNEKLLQFVLPKDAVEAVDGYEAEEFKFTPERLELLNRYETLHRHPIVTGRNNSNANYYRGSNAYSNQNRSSHSFKARNTSEVLGFDVSMLSDNVLPKSREELAREALVSKEREKHEPKKVSLEQQEIGRAHV